MLWAVPAGLLGFALEPLPTAILVDDYVTVEGRKLSKSAAEREIVKPPVPDTVKITVPDTVKITVPDTVKITVPDTVKITVPDTVKSYGPDALRWWFLRDVPRSGDGDFRAATGALRAAVAEADRHVGETRPWELEGARLAAVVATRHATCRAIAAELAPFPPGAALRIDDALASGDRSAARRIFPEPAP